MYRRIIAGAAILSLNVTVVADYQDDHKAAMELVKAGKNEEAMSAFEKMGKSTADEAQKNDAFEQAAICASNLKKYDQALELAGQIPQVPMAKAVKIRIMFENNKHKELLAAFKEEDMSAWPEKAAGPAYFYRGRAYMTVRDGKAAEADLKKVVSSQSAGKLRDQAFLYLGKTYCEILNDDAQALANFAEVTKSGANYGWINLSCITSSSDILVKQKKYDEALAILAKVDSSKMPAVWKYNFILAYANVAGAQGKKEEAIAKLNEGLAGKDIAEWQKQLFQQKLKELNAGETR